MNLVKWPSLPRVYLDQLVRVPNRYLGGRGFQSCWRFRFLFFPTLMKHFVSSFLHRAEICHVNYLQNCIEPDLISYQLEQFKIECRKTKSKVITPANHKGCRTIHLPIKTPSNYTKRGKTCASKSRLVLAFTSDWSRKSRVISEQNCLT